MDNKETWKPEDLRNTSSSWTLQADKKLLQLLEKMHENTVSQAQDTTEKLKNLTNELEKASLSLNLVNNRFMGLSNTQFVENLVQEDDVEVINKETEEKEDLSIKSPTASNEKDKFSTIAKSLDILESMCDQIEISSDSDSEPDNDETDDQNSILQLKDPYANYKLPPIIGSEEWLALYRNDNPLIEEDKADDEGFTFIPPKGLNEKSNMSLPLPVPQYTPSTSVSTSCENEFEDDRRSNRASLDRLEDKPIPEQSAPQKAPQMLAKPSDFAAELARKLGGNIPPPIPTPNAAEDKSKTLPVYKPSLSEISAQAKRVTGNIFLDEPPPLEVSDNTPADEYFKHPNPDNDETDDFMSSNIFESSKTPGDGLFTKKTKFGGLFDDFPEDSEATPKKTNPVPQKKQGSLFDDFDEFENNSLFASNSSKVSTPKEKPITAKKQVKGLFDDDDNDEIFEDTANNKIESLPSSKAKNNSLFGDSNSDDDDLFKAVKNTSSTNSTSKSKPANVAINNSTDSSVRETKKSKLFGSDSDDDDDLFKTLRIPPKTSQNPPKPKVENNVVIPQKQEFKEPVQTIRVPTPQKRENKEPVQTIKVPTPQKRENKEPVLDKHVVSASEKQENDFPKPQKRQTEESIQQKNDISIENTREEEINVPPLKKAESKASTPQKVERKATTPQKTERKIPPAQIALPPQKVETKTPSLQKAENNDITPVKESTQVEKIQKTEDISPSITKKEINPTPAPRTFHDEPPPDSDTKKSKESLFEKQATSLFDDDEDEPELFSKRTEPRLSHNSLFNDGPPPLDDDTPEKSKNVNSLFDDDDDDDLFSSIRNITESGNAKPASIDIFSDKPPDLEEIKTELPNDYTYVKKLNVATPKTLEMNKPNNSETASSISDIKSNLFKQSSESSQKSPSPTKVGKLQSNLNINVKALIPGATVKIQKSDLLINAVKSSESDNIDSVEESSSSSISEETKPKPKTSESILDNAIAKDRVKIPIKRRPSTRKARQEAIRKSAADLVYSFEEKKPTSNDFVTSLPNSPLSENPETTVKDKDSDLFNCVEDKSLESKIESNLIPEGDESNLFGSIKKSTVVDAEIKVNSGDIFKKSSPEITEALPSIPEKKPTDLFDVFKKTPDANVSNVMEEKVPEPKAEPVKQAKQSDLFDIFKKDDQNVSKSSNLFSDDDSPTDIFKSAKSKAKIVTEKKSSDLFGDSDDDDLGLFSNKSSKNEKTADNLDIFTAKSKSSNDVKKQVEPQVKNTSKKTSLFGGDDEDDDNNELFLKSSKTSSLWSSKSAKTITKSLFGDDNDDDDDFNLFKPKKVLPQAKVSAPNSSKQSVGAFSAEVTNQDPLSSFQDD